MNNKVIYRNRHGDQIQFEHIDNQVIMTGGSWFRYGWPNVYDKAYEAYINDHTENGMDLETFKNEVHNYKDEAMRPYSQLVYSDRDTIDMVDPSGGPYISLGNNLNAFWPKDSYQDLIINKIEIEYTKGEKPEAIVTFTVNEKDKTT